MKKNNGRSRRGKGGGNGIGGMVGGDAKKGRERDSVLKHQRRRKEDMSNAGKKLNRPSKDKKENQKGRPAGRVIAAAGKWSRGSHTNIGGQGKRGGGETNLRNPQNKPEDNAKGTRT